MSVYDNKSKTEQSPWAVEGLHAESEAIQLYFD